MGEFSLQWPVAWVVLAGGCSLVVLLLFLAVLLLGSMRRCLAHLEGHLMDIGADLRTISLRIALNDGARGQDGAAEGEPVAQSSSTLPQALPRTTGYTSATPNQLREVRARYIHQDTDAAHMATRLSAIRDDDYADAPSANLAADLIKQTHFDPPENHVKAEAPRQTLPPLSPEEEGDIWRLRAVRKSVRGVSASTEQARDASGSRQEPTLRWPPKTHQE